MNSSKNILLLGGTGLLGSTLAPYLKDKGLNVVTHGFRKKADINSDLTQQGNMALLLDRLKPDVVINLIGLTSVETCQNEPNQAYLLNTKIVEELASWIKNNQTNTYIVQISTDQLYDGTGPHLESDVRLTNIYALTKYAAEISVRQMNSVVLRTNFVGKSMVESRESLTDWVYSAVSNGQDVFVLDDVLFSPLSMKTLSEILLKIINLRIVGVYNLGSIGGMSKAEFDYKFAKMLGKPFDNLKKIKSDEATFLKAYRPKDMRLNCDLIQLVTNIQLPKLIDEIARVVLDYK